jgi:hypothetical protein
MNILLYKPHILPNTKHEGKGEFPCLVDKNFTDHILPNHQQKWTSESGERSGEMFGGNPFAKARRKREHE